MRPTVTGLVCSILVLGGCIAAPGPSGPPAVISPSTASTPSVPPASSPAPSPSYPASPAATFEPTAEPETTIPPFPTDVPAVSVPRGIDDIAWGGMQIEGIAEGEWIGHLHGGMLGSAPTIDVEIETPAGYPNPLVAGGIVATTSRPDGDGVHLQAWHGSDGTRAIDLEVAGVDASVILDPDRDLVYTAASKALGGVEIRRRSFDGTTNDLLVDLDKRFTPDGIPTERYGLIIDPDGVLVVEACADDGGCRLWEIPPGLATAPRPRVLPGRPPIVCRIQAVTRDWLIVTDDAACWADTGDAPLPVRAIRRADGVSHVVTDDHVSIGRALELDGTTSLIGVDDFFMGATVDLVRYDVVSGKKTVLGSGLAPNPADQTVVVMPTVLPDAWLLLAPGFVDTTGLPSGPAHLLDLSTGATIELPIGTFGWN